MATTAPPRPPRLPRLLARLIPGSRVAADERLIGPIRGELFGAERLAEFAREVARRQVILTDDRRRGTGPLLLRLDETWQILTEAREVLGDAADRDVDVSPAGEWLLDNFYVVQEHVREIRTGMPKGFYRELPKLGAGSLAGYPRVYELAIELIAHTEGHIDAGNIELFVREFQRISPLSLGELWAIPTMLRLGLVENIRRMTLRTMQRLVEVEAADAWATRIREASAASPKAQTEALNAFVASPPELSPAFVTRFLQQIRAYQTGFTPLVWLEQWIAEDGMSAEEAVTRANQRVALTQVMMANSITSLRTIGRLDWRAFVEAQSIVDRLLRRDPSGHYASLTFGTRDHYRHVIERLARRTESREQDVAELAITLSQEQETGRRESHVGYWLIDEGRPALEERVGYRPSFGEQVHRFIVRYPNLVYFGSIASLLLVALVPVIRLAGDATLLALLLALIPASEIAIGIVNQLVTVFMPPRTLPKIELREQGIPPEYATVVVVPTLLPNLDSVGEAFEHLEVQFLANRDSNLRFALLSDFTDAPAERVETDEAILRAAIARVTELNAQYGDGGDTPFYLFHRPRRWNELQGTWMAWERKRGKLGEFNRFLRGDRQAASGDGDAFSVVIGNVEPLQACRYVITLDSDTVLPPESAHLLIGAMAHPLNRAVYDESLGRVVEGYGILQPRIGVSLTSAHKSYFASIHSGHPGVDPYTTAVSDVYQDLFAEGSFTGKGIYDVDAFERAVHGRFPENTLLSHDLIEGAFARAALITDVELFDDYPTRYLTFTRRKHRWIRGDWQLLRWLGSKVPGPGGLEENRLSAISRWKIFDNLRRSVVELSLLMLIAVAWLLPLPGSPIAWTLLVLGAIAFPWVFSLGMALARPPRDQSWLAYYKAVAGDARVSAQQLALAIVFLPHQAWVSADAIVRTLHRLLVSRRQLLEWQTASQVERAMTKSGPEIWRVMRPAIIVAVALTAAAMLRGPSVPLALCVVPLALLWVASPAIANALSAPALRPELSLSSAERPTAMKYAFLHWRFFERFVTSETQWLAPDNFQEDPLPVVAPRTSPTNIGLQLLSIVAAHDMGFITRASMVERIEQVFRTLERMRRYRGHFFNWYDLTALAVLEPAYISTVDSGNLAGHCLALKQACLDVAERPVQGTPFVRALRAALRHTSVVLRDLGTSGAIADAAAWQAARSVSEQVQRVIRDLETANGAEEAALRTAAESLRGIESSAAALITPGMPGAGDEAVDLLRWSHTHADAAVAELSALASEQARVDLADRLEAIATRAHATAMEMDFTFLFDDRRKLFSIGYQVAAAQRDASFYDLLASESRLASFVAIAKGDVPVEHWFRLGRTITQSGTATALVSWSGSMFEYLMPLLVMRGYPFTLLDQTYRGAVRAQEEYGAERNVPWGISESAYNVRDREATYQYRAFGVPSIALKRGLRKELVVAPYATALAIQVQPHAAIRNFASLESEGALGPYGFREAIDYSRPNPGTKNAVVGAYFAHHIGMSFLALYNALQRRALQDWFHADPLVRAAELLLFERVPRRLVLSDPADADTDDTASTGEAEQPAVRVVETPDTAQPHVALLANLPYTVMVTNSGAGYSRYEAIAVTRWRNDGTQDNYGQWCYVRDLSGGRTWSIAHQPTGVRADWYRAIFSSDRVTFHRRDGDIETSTDITVVPEDRAEVRRVTVTNHSAEAREIELTSYGEVVLTHPDADRAHPAFHNLFVQTEWIPNLSAILATRRPRSAKEERRWCVHVVAVGRERSADITFETDRAKFVGRGRSTRNPRALDEDGTLSGTAGAVLDPIFSLRVRVRLAPGQLARVAFTTLITETRERAIELADRYNEPYAAQRALDLSWTHAQVELRDLGVSPQEAALYQQLAGHLFHSHAPLRAPQQELRANRGHQELLWSAGISGDWPILLAFIDSTSGLPSVRQLLRAHQYLRMKGMMIDLVFLNTQPHTYAQDLGDSLLATIMASSEGTLLDQPGGVFIRRQDLLSAEVIAMLRATARVHVTCDGLGIGKLLEAMEPEVLAAIPIEPSQHEAGGAAAHRRSRAVLALDAARHAAPPISLATPSRSVAAPATTPSRSQRPIPDPRRLSFFNGYGGFNREGEYEIRVDGAVPPAPWSNIIANEHGGFCVSESGGGFTWAGNSYFYRLTPWRNDPITDQPSEVVYITDVASGESWSATPAPTFHPAAFIVRHAHGTSTFEQEHNGIASSLVVGMAATLPVKLSLLTLRNSGPTPRKLRVTSYLEWVLGVAREHSQYQVHTRFNHEQEVLLAQNTWDWLFADRVAFVKMSEPLSGHTADRREFIGRNGSMARPRALRRERLEGTIGVGYDPCAALQTEITLGAGEKREIVIVLGAMEGEDAARETAVRFADPSVARAELEASVAAWQRRLGVITVTTPAPAFDALVNRWVLYQAMSCRFLGRSAVYQSSGAYGFRDQLQDVLAFLHSEPGMAREHIVRAAGRQFVEGDVQHWWHPHSGRGVRTKFSDDLAWLPFVVEHYARVTGDESVFDERAPFITMRPLGPDEHEIYDLPMPSGEDGTIYEHCVRALRRACTKGTHGLPLMGIGDWNDGMNRVGVEGRGESVWLAWFLVYTLRQFAGVAERRGDDSMVRWAREMADGYVDAVERTSWDGEWYRRAYFDDGSPLGSKSSDECRIDSIAQSWSVLSGAGQPERSRQAMESLDQHLVREDGRLIMLLKPAFDAGAKDPGYIKGYLPGVRENGAQYTHAALWAALAAATMGDGDRAFRYFQFLNPITHGDDAASIETYMVEPYVVAADVYTAEGHLGRGGWTWYTGSASWMYRVAIEGILGIERRGNLLIVNPCIPKEWDGFQVEYRVGETVYAIDVRNPEHVNRGVKSIHVDGRQTESIALQACGAARREIVIVLG